MVYPTADQSRLPSDAPHPNECQQVATIHPTNPECQSTIDTGPHVAEFDTLLADPGAPEHDTLLATYTQNRVIYNVCKTSESVEHIVDLVKTYRELHRTGIHDDLAILGGMPEHELCNKLLDFGQCS